jgi:hypothetical protein
MMQSNIVKQTGKPVTDIIPKICIMTFAGREINVYFLPFSLN